MAQSDGAVFSSHVSGNGGGAVAHRVEVSPMRKAVPPGCKMTAGTRTGNDELQVAEKRK